MFTFCLGNADDAAQADGDKASADSGAQSDTDAKDKSQSTEQPTELPADADNAGAKAKDEL